MMAAVHSGLEPEQRWEFYRHEIQVLYLEENLELENDGGLMDIMAKRYNFHATKSQYERYLKKWDFKKYLKNPQASWTAITQTITKRKRSGRESDVFINGKLVPQKRIKKETSRYGKPLNSEESQGDLPLPRGVRVVTPELSIDVGVRIQGCFTNFGIYGSLSVLENLPFLRFTEQIDSKSLEGKLVQDFLGSKAPLIRLLFYLVSNDLLSQVSGDFIRRFCNEANASALGFILPNESPAADAFCEKILPFVLESDNTNLLRAMLKRYSHPDDIILKWNGRLVTPLIIACSQQNLNQAKVLLQCGANATKFMSSKYISPLYCTINPLQTWRGDDVKSWSSWDRDDTLSSTFVNEELVRILIEAGADINVSSEGGHNLLHSVVRMGNLNLTKLLLSRGFEVNTHGPDDANVLHLLASNSLRFDEFTVSKIAEELINAGVNLENEFKRENRYGMELRITPITAIDEAARRGNLHLFRVLLFSGAKPSSKTLGYAMESENSDLINYLVEALQENSICLPTPTNLQLVPVIRSGNITIFQMMLRLGIIPESDIQLRNAIRAAASIGNLEMIEMLVKFAIYLSINWRGLTRAAVRGAVTAGHSSLARLLISSGFDCHYSAVNEAIMQKDAELTAELLKACSDTFDTSCCLVSAVVYREYSLVKCLLARGCDPNSIRRGERDVKLSSTSQYTTALSEAVRLSDFRLVEILLDAGADINILPPRKIHFRSPLAQSVMAGNIKMTKLLLDAGANPDDTMAICEAAGASHIEAVKILLDAYRLRYAKCRSGYGCEALKQAIVQQNLDLVRILLSFGVDPNVEMERENQLSAAVFSSASEDMNIIREVLAATFEHKGPLGVSGRDRLRIISLIMAIRKRHLPAMKLLIDVIVNVNQSVFLHDGEKFPEKTPLQAACERGYVDAVQLLLSSGANVNSPAAAVCGATALQFAAIGGHIGIAVLLIEHGAEVNAPGSKFNGRSALEGAAELGRIDMLQLLINAGACTDIKNEQYLRAIQLAMKNGHFAAKKLLESTHI